LGAEEEVEVDTTVLPIRPEDRLILCSDGLSDMVPETEIRDLLTSYPEDPERAARALVSAALDAGGQDNVTVVIVDVREEDSPVEESPRRDTQEMRALAPEEVGAPRRRERPQGRRTWGKRAASHVKGGSSWRPLGMYLVRALAVVLALALLATPFYLWGTSRYFLGFDNGQVVVYRGLPYAPLGYALNEEVRRTGLTESQVQDRYRDEIETHKLYSSEEQADAVVGGLKASEPSQR
jgi:protein phosphatase